ncbi:MAG: MYXO-CTERM sorting domain-containing protein [Deltaproteobacteria bacterium]|nr:MYXO-CTERM sorting domain-containing protein [Myxococcales bacterium]MDP3216160.1 MYXO-CTERM sorting domain-containing protein [Deltaproteobacteria bacterium]
MSHRARLAPLLALLLAAATAHAQPRPVALSAVEHALGASPLHMVAGHGRLTAGVTRDGDLAVLTWPSPSCCDQLTHLSTNALDARTRPRTGVREGFGVALGVVVETASGTRVEWLHDPARWRPVASYADERSLQPRVTYTRVDGGLTITLDDAVLPSPDVLQRRVRYVRTEDAAGMAIRSVALMAHANLGLTQNVIPRLPFGDVLADSRNDFGVVYDRALGAFVHFRPTDRAPITDLTALVSAPELPANHFGPLDALLRRDGDLTADADALAASLDTTFTRGVYAVVGSEPRADAFHAGREGDDFCDELGLLVDNVLALRTSGIVLPLDPGLATGFRCPDAVRPSRLAVARGWTRSTPSAWSLASTNTLAGNPVAAYLNDSALRVPFTTTGLTGEARLLIAFGSTAAEARTAYGTARALPPAEVIRRDSAEWERRAGALAVPEHLPETIPLAERTRITRAARRAMLHVLNGTDAATGMVVASIARQAPYGLDWPRDGAFFDDAFDVGGLPGNTTRRLDWALPLARTTALGQSDINPLTDPRPPVDPRTGTRQYPESAWEMNYYNTGAMGGFFRFEIDNTALMVWSASTHLAFLSNEERMTTAARWWPGIRRSADLLADWRDAETGLHALANEDDNAAFSATLHGGTTVFAALESCARVARLMGEPAVASRWERRASELRDALVRRFYDPTMQRFVNDVTGAAASNPGSSALGATAWMVWPAAMFAVTDERVARQMRSDMERVLAALRGDPGTEGGAYLTKTMLAAAVFVGRGGDPTLRPLVEESLVRMARDVITDDTQVMGEVFITLRDADGGVIARENRVSTPHLWEATLFYLATMALSEPERFDFDRRALPPAMIPPPGTVPLPEPMADAGAVMDATMDVPQVFDAGAAMDAGRDPFAVPTGPGDCACAVPGPAPMGGARGWMALGALGLWAARRRRRRA